MADINKEIGLEDLLRGIGMEKPASHGETSSTDGDEKTRHQTTEIEHA